MPTFDGKKLGRKLGCGIEGCVFSYKKGTVVKITESENEFETAQKLISLQNKGDIHPALPVIYGFEFEEDRNRDFGPYKIWREDLKDAPLEKLPEDYDAIPRLTARIRLENYSLEEDLELYRRDGETPSKELLQFLRFVTELYEWCKNRDIFISDFHEKNWGLRGNLVVLRDLG